MPLPLGGAWLHGEIGHPLAPMVTWVEEEWADRMMFVVGHGRLDDVEVAEMRDGYARVHDRFAAADPSQSVGEVMVAALADMPELSPVVRAGLESWLTIECESLFAAPVGDMPANGGFEDYELDGDDRLITSSLGDVIDRLADGLDVRCDHRVGALAVGRRGLAHRHGARGEAVIVTIPIGALRAGRIEWSPALPDAVIDAIGHLGAGPVTKVFATFDERWWPPVRPLRFAGQADLLAVTDMTDLTGVPTLCGFATGESARRIEHLSEHDLCLLVDRAVTETGLRDWDRNAERVNSCAQLRKESRIGGSQPKKPATYWRRPSSASSATSRPASTRLPLPSIISQPQRTSWWWASWSPTRRNEQPG